MAAIHSPKFEKRKIEPFKPHHIRQLRAQCDLINSRFEQARNRAMVLTFLDTGLRSAELANLKLEDIDEDRIIIKVMEKRAKGINKYFLIATSISITCQMLKNSKIG
jgi:integrase/recombinase XerC